jgi:CheY-like chemotaxis protein
MGRNWAEGTTILAVEDDILTARLIRARLELEGLRVLEARNGFEGLALLKTEGADLVSTDLMMPAMDGYRLIREIRELPAPLGTLPVLILSMNQNEDDMVRCLAAGADDYMTKPLSPQVYIEKLWRLYSRSRA